MTGAEKLQKKALRKQKEIAKWEKQLQRPESKNYIYYMILLVSLIYVTDEIASQIGTLMKTEIANDLMSKFGEKSVAALDVVSFIGIGFQAFSIFYKPLSDRFGRKLFLVVNTFGMGLGLFFISLTHGLVTYIIGTVIIMFFVPHDMQVVYIMEASPAKHRARIYSSIKCVATLGILLVPVMRNVMMHTPEQWRMVYLVPGIVGLVSSLIALLLSRETKPFIDSRLAYLRMSDEELAREKEKKSSKDSQGGFFAGLKFAFRHKQLRWVYIVTALVNFGVIITMHYEVVISYGFAQNFVNSGTYDTMKSALSAASTGPVTQALFLFPVGSAFAQLLVGYIADSLGRKKSAIFMTALTLASFVIFTLGSKNGWNAYVVGLFMGAAVGGYWGVSDLTGILVSESAPTQLRSSVISGQFICMGVGYIMAYVVGLPLIGKLGNTAVPVISLCIAVPGLAAALVFMVTKVHETKGIDLDTVTGCEWD